MKDYPSIPKTNVAGMSYVYVFDKLDGSNIRAEFTKKNGFCKFGSKTQLLCAESGILNESIELIKDKYSKDFERIVKNHKYESCVAFFEFFGANSFAGNHIEEKHDVVLIDVNVYKQGIIPPNDFVKIFQDVDHAKLLHQGLLSDSGWIYDAVKTGTLDGMTFEGVVVKGKLDRKTNVPAMFKIKNQAWLDKLKLHCKGDEKLFEKLA